MDDWVKATCHCGAVELRVKLTDGLNSIHRCDCSYCRRRQAAPVTAAITDLEIVKGAENLTLYSWNTHTAKHYFCKTCGIYTHHQRRSNPNEYGVNAANIDGVNPKELEPIPWFDGVNHPSDK